LPIIAVDLPLFVRFTNDPWSGEGFRTQAFALDYAKLREAGVEAKRPWAGWLAEQVLLGLHRERMKQSVFVGYHHGPDVVLLRFFSRSDRHFIECHKLLREVLMESGAGVCNRPVCPLVLLDVEESAECSRLFPLPEDDKPGVLVVDHGCFLAGVCISFKKKEADYIRQHPEKYPDYELVPTEEQGVLSIGRTRVSYFNRFACSSE